MVCLALIVVNMDIIILCGVTVQGEGWELPELEGISPYPQSSTFMVQWPMTSSVASELLLMK